MKSFTTTGTIIGSFEPHLVQHISKNGAAAQALPSADLYQELQALFRRYPTAVKARTGKATVVEVLSRLQL